VLFLINLIGLLNGLQNYAFLFIIPNNYLTGVIFMSVSLFDVLEYEGWLQED
jgi:hypothetical protein